MRCKVWSLGACIKQSSVIFIAASIVVVSSAIIQDNSVQVSDPLQSAIRIKRDLASAPAEHPANEGTEAIKERDKKAPRAFLGLRGKKALSGFLGLRGRRSDNEDYSEEEFLPYRSYDEGLEDVYPRLGKPLHAPQRVAHALELFKRAPSGFLGMRGKKAPSGFLGMRGKKAPSSFLGLRGKKTPSGFLGMRGKKEDSDYDDLEDVLQTLRNRYANNQEYYTGEKRAPRGFLGLRGKKSSSDYPMYDPIESDTYRSMNGADSFYERLDKRAPSRFLGLRG